MTAKQRFYAKVRLDEETGCWLWTAAVAPTGYATFTDENRKTVLAHRWAYRVFVGPLVGREPVDHVWDRGCRYRHCVNPEHLELVTQSVNAMRASASYKTGRCSQGHLRVPGQRNCPECVAARAVQWRRDHLERAREIQRAYRARKRAKMAAISAVTESHALLQRSVEG